MAHLLAPGVTLNLHQIQPFLLGLDGTRVLLDAAEVAEGEALCLGAETLGPLGRRLSAQGLVVEGGDPVDPLLLEKLQRLDAMYAWWADRLTPEQHRAWELAQQAHASRKRFLWSAGQCPTLPETALRRALSAPAEPCDALCLGDDDLVCVPLAALGHRVTVIDLDDYLLRLIDRFAAAHGLPIETAAVDLTRPLDPRWARRFDVCFTDPCSNRECLELFCSRAVSCLREGGELHVAVMYPAETLYRQIARQMALPVTGFQHDFNHYYWSSMRLADYTSDQYSHRKSGRTCPILLADRPAEASEDLFADYDTPHEHPYTIDLYQVDLARLDEASALLAAAIELAGSTLHDAGGRWSFSANRARGGYVNLTVDRERREMKLTLMPLDLAEERRARAALQDAFGGKALVCRTSSGPEVERF